MGNLFKKIKIVKIIGARPQFIKAAAFSNSIKSYDSIDEVVIHTKNILIKIYIKFSLINY